MASMYVFMQNAEVRLPYRCRGCAARLEGAENAPGSANAALRALWAYPMVKDPEGTPRAASCSRASSALGARAAGQVGVACGVNTPTHARGGDTREGGRP